MMRGVENSVRSHQFVGAHQISPTGFPHAVTRLHDMINLFDGELKSDDTDCRAILDLDGVSGKTGRLAVLRGIRPEVHKALLAGSHHLTPQLGQSRVFVLAVSQVFAQFAPFRSSKHHVPMLCADDVHIGKATVFPEPGDAGTVLPPDILVGVRGNVIRPRGRYMGVMVVLHKSLEKMADVLAAAENGHL